MHHPDAIPDSAELTRRQLLHGGGALLGLALLAGCKSHEAAYPDPVWPGQPRVPSTTARGPSTITMPPGPAIAASAPSAPVAGVPAGVIRRSAWTRAGVARPSEILPMRGITRITVHHDGMNAFTSTSQDAAATRIEQIRRAHVAGAVHGEPFADIGYHYIIDPAGRVWEGRSVQYQGAHVKENNEQNLGVLCMGNYDIQSPTPATNTALDRFVASQMRLYHVPVNRVYTHREIRPTECPGRNLQRYMVATRAKGGGLAVALADIGAAELALA